jgi:hypothetical protein
MMFRFVAAVHRRPARLANDATKRQAIALFSLTSHTRVRRDGTVQGSVLAPFARYALEFR